MSTVLVVGEDALCCAFGERFVDSLLVGWTLARESINAGGVTKLAPNLPRYVQQARRVQPVICIADTDGQCPVELIEEWLPSGVEHNFLLRMAVTEAESWLMSDPETLAEFLQVSPTKIPRQPDGEPDPKRTLLSLAGTSRSRQIRAEVVSSSDRTKPGNGYNAHLCRYVREHWRVNEAVRNSPSAARAAQRIGSLRTRPD